ncbi:MAG: hypothetical protein ACJ75J_10875 [Cytophagaceae bacterium]
MTEKTSDLNSSDAWLMLSISEISGGGSLRTIVSVGDYINHSIFNPEEIEDGLKRLSAIGYVNIRGQKISSSAKFRKAWDGMKKPKGMIQQLYLLQEHLGTKTYTKASLKAVLPKIPDRKTIEGAIKEYLKGWE